MSCSYTDGDYCPFPVPHLAMENSGGELCIMAYWLYDGVNGPQSILHPALEIIDSELYTLAHQ